LILVSFAFFVQRKVKRKRYATRIHVINNQHLFSYKGLRENYTPQTYLYIPPPSRV